MNKVQTLKNMLGRLAKQVVLLSHENGVVVLDEGRALKLTKGQYGGWLTWEKDAHDAYQGLWCYKAVRRKPSQEDLQMAKEALERLKKIANSLGVRTAPKIIRMEYKYRIVTAKREKSTDRYSVYEIAPTGDEATATAVKIELPYKVGKYGRCSNDVCRHYDKLKRLIEAEFRGSEALIIGVSVVMPLDTSELERAVAKILGIEEVEEAAEEAGAEEEAAKGGGAEGEEGGGGRRYLVAALPDAVDGEAVIDAVKEALKKLGVKEPLVKIIEAEF